MLIRRTASLHSRKSALTTLRTSARATLFSAPITRLPIRTTATPTALATSTCSICTQTLKTHQKVKQISLFSTAKVLSQRAEPINRMSVLSRPNETYKAARDSNVISTGSKEFKHSVNAAFDQVCAESASPYVRGYENTSNPSSLWLSALLVTGYPISVLALLLIGCVFVTKSFDPSEKEIKHEPLDLKLDKHHGYIVDAKDFITTGTKIKGHLSGCIVEDTRTGTRYLKKGATSLEALIKEFLISNFLYMIRPGEQPNSLLMEEIQPDGSARFYTLSRIYPKSMDLEDFIFSGDWREKLAKKPLIGFEVAMAADMLFAKQQDMKLANYIVIEKEDCYVVACIDHEKSGQSLIHKTTMVDKIDMEFCSHIVDINHIGQEYRVGLYNNPDALEFMRVAQKFMKIENIQEFYKRVAYADPQKIVRLIRDIDGRNGIIDEIYGHKYMKELFSICERAAIVSFDTDEVEVINQVRGFK